MAGVTKFDKCRSRPFPAYQLGPRLYTFFMLNCPRHNEDTPMTDNSQQPARAGLTKSSLDVILRMIAQNVTPAIVGYLCACAPILNESTWFEITVFVLAGAGSMLNNFTPNHIVDAIVDGIIWIKQAWKRIWNAVDQP